MPILADHSKCTGCLACVNSCQYNNIQIKKEQGFWYPSICYVSCIECHKCKKVCPVINSVNSFSYDQAFACYTKTNELRKQSSSGGIFSELALSIIVQNGIVYGAAYDENGVVKHIAVTDEENLYSLRGAKYSQSDLGNTYSEIQKHLREGKQVLFSGTPCQVAGLKAFLKKEYKHLITVDFVCHGVPSPVVWKEYLTWKKEKDGKNGLPIQINLRDKSTGWSRYRYSTSFIYEDEKVSCLNGENIFIKLFVGDYINRESCSDCHFKGYSRISDFTLGDFWGIWDIMPKMDDDKGTSLVLIHSNKGRGLWEKLSNRIVASEVTLEQTSQQNPSLLISSPSKPNREEVLELALQGRFDELEKMFHTAEPSFYQKCRDKLSQLKARILKVSDE